MICHLLHRHNVLHLHMKDVNWKDTEVRWRTRKMDVVELVYMVVEKCRNGGSDRNKEGSEGKGKKPLYVFKDHFKR